MSQSSVQSVSADPLYEVYVELIQFKNGSRPYNSKVYAVSLTVSRYLARIAETQRTHPGWHHLRGLHPEAERAEGKEKGGCTLSTKLVISCPSTSIQSNLPLSKDIKLQSPGLSERRLALGGR